MADFKNPDINAPRYRRPLGKGVIMAHMLKALRVRNPGKFDSIKDLDAKNIITVFNQLMQEEVIANPDGLDLPSKLGFVQLVNCPSTKKENINYNLSVKLVIIETKS